MAGNPFDQFDAPTAPQGGIRIGTPDPRRANQEARDQAAAARAAAAEIRAQTTFNERNNPKPSDIKPLLTAKERADAIGGYKSAIALDALVADMEAKFQAGPGTTSGLSGLADFLPTEANTQFDAAGNAARGTVGQALGFTGGQLNTATEAAMAVGPYLPKSSDYDSVATDKIQRLRELATQARERSIAILGGIPDENGKIAPVSAANPAPPAPANTPPRETADRSAMFQATEPDQGQAAVATGSTRQDADPRLSAALTQMMRDGNRTPADINAWLQSYGAEQIPPAQIAEWRKYLSTPQGRAYKGVTGQVNRTVPTTAMEEFGASVPGAFVRAAAKGVTANFAPRIKANLQTGFGLTGDTQAATRANLAEDEAVRRASSANGWASLAGDVVGGAAGQIGPGSLLGRIPRVAGMAARLGRTKPFVEGAAYGGVYGANENPDNPLAGAAMGMFAGAGGTALGQGAGKALGATLAGVSAPAARRLGDAGVRMTGGQILRDRGGMTGQIIGGLEDAATSTPLVGDVITAARNGSLESMNRAAFNRGGSPIGAQIDDIGSNGIAQFDAARGGAYDSSLSRMDLNLDPRAAQQFGPRIAAQKGLAPDEVAKFLPLMKQVAGRVAPVGQTSGQTVQGMKQILRTESRALKGQPGAQFVREAIGEADRSLMNAARQQQPQAYADYMAADAANGNFKTLSAAVNAASGRAGNPGVFGGAQLATALKGAKVTQSTRDMLGQLAEDAVRVLPSQLADSGTGKRMALNALTGSSVGAGTAFAPAIGAPVIGAGSIMAFLNSPAGRKLVQAALIGDRGAKATAIGNSLKSNARLGGAATSAALLPYAR